jgi:threonine/homoserine/homoserine lactone efflux protein
MDLATARAARVRRSIVIDHFGAFLTISMIVIITPGQDMALVMRNTLVGGRGGGVTTGLGVVTGLAIWAIATSAGLAAVLLASEPVFAALRLAGAAYLIWLGLQALRTAVSPRPSHDAPHGTLPARSRRGAVAFRQGIVSNLGNPKIAVFFTSLMPQFTSCADASFGALLVLGLAFCGLTLAWLMIYAVVIAKAGDVLRRPRIRRILEGLVGGVLVGLGLRLALERR